jgi:hypothetical protein
MDESAASLAIMAGLAHDMGEMYVNPDLINAKRELTFEEWKGLAVHPRIGAVLLAEYGKFPASVVHAVQQHHERIDGSGYPAGLAGDRISPLGSILIVAEVMSAILPSSENPEDRALLALRLVKGQFEPKIVSLLSSVYRDYKTSIPNGFNPTVLTGMAQTIANRLKLCEEEARKITAQSELPDNWRELAEHVRLSCQILSMSINSSGVLSALSSPAAEMQDDPSIANELHVIITELNWRMRSLSRNVALCAMRWERSMEIFDSLVQSLYVDDIAEANDGTGESAAESISVGE